MHDNLRAGSFPKITTCIFGCITGLCMSAFPGGALHIQVTGMIEWGQKSHAEFLSLKNLQKGKQVCLYCNLRTMRLRYTGTIMNLLIVLNGQKNPYLNQATQNNTCQILLPKKSQNQKFQTQNNPSIIRHLKSGIPPGGAFKAGPRGHPSPLHFPFV